MESRLAAFIKRLAIGLRAHDPFDDDYFELREHVKAADDEEEDLAAAAISYAHWKKEKYLKGQGTTSGRWKESLQERFEDGCE